MNLSNLIDHRSIEGKDIFIFEDHAQALLPWATLRRRFGRPLNLITLDHHTDTLSPFLRYRCRCSKQGDFDVDDNAVAAMLAPLLASVDWRSEQSVLNAVLRLRNDEHIATATLTGIVDWAFSINLTHTTTSSREEDDWISQPIWKPRSARPRPPFTYEPPADRIFKVSSICAIGCPKGPHDDECTPVHYGQVLESIYLDEKLDQAQRMYAAVGGGDLLTSAPYILDIDLDYFHSDKAIRPEDPRTFYDMVRGAAGITIAREPSFVSEGRLPGQRLTPASLEHDLLVLIKTALTPT